jgi:5-methylcytosine-specific restriction protein A
MALGKRNPDWTRDELILALDVYFRHRPLKIGKTHPEIVNLSRLLNSLSIHINPADGQTFRNPNGVYMKLGNFLRLDPEYAGKGLAAGAAADEIVWNDFSSDREALAATAAAIRLNTSARKQEGLPVYAVPEEEEFPEGRVLFRAHVARERNPRLVKQAKERALQRHAKLVCNACGFDFESIYGELGKDYIECHHVIPISQLAPSSKTRVQDTVLVCSNCHRMIHRRRPWLGMGELQRLLAAGESSVIAQV